MNVGDLPVSLIVYVGNQFLHSLNVIGYHTDSSVTDMVNGDNREYLISEAPEPLRLEKSTQATTTPSTPRYLQCSR